MWHAYAISFFASLMILTIVTLTTQAQVKQDGVWTDPKDKMLSAANQFQGEAATAAFIRRTDWRFKSSILLGLTV
jgi:hypothetical protein